jgi:hypothetical protein
VLSAAIAALALTAAGLGTPAVPGAVPQPADDSHIEVADVVGVVGVGEVEVVVTDVGDGPAGLTQADDDGPTDTVTPATVPPGDTISEFMPEDRGLGDCVGLVERPGCGSGARGGWRQGLILGAVVLAFAFIAWRIVRASRRARGAPATNGHGPPS